LDFATSPFVVPAGVLVANGAPAASTTVFFQIPIVDESTFGTPSATWVGRSEGDVSGVSEIEVYPAASPVGAMWLEELGASMDSSILDIGSAVDLGSGISADLVEGGPQITLSWNQAGRGFTVIAPSATMSASSIQMVGRKAVAAVATGSWSSATVVASDNDLVAVAPRFP
jgi:hypothetical protein